jgi:hypothetical protein
LKNRFSDLKSIPLFARLVANNFSRFPLQKVFGRVFLRKYVFDYFTILLAKKE